MSKKHIPRINPRIREASDQFLKNSSVEKRVRLQVLKQQLVNGTYRLNSTTLARSLVPTN